MSSKSTYPCSVWAVPRLSCLLPGCGFILQTRTRFRSGIYLEVLSRAVRSSREAPKTTVPDGVSKAKLSYDFERLEKGSVAGRGKRSGILPGFAALDCLAYAYEITGDTSWLQAGLRTLEAFFDDHPGYFHGATFSRFRDPVPEGKPFAVAYRTLLCYLNALHRENLLGRFEYRECS